MMLSDEHVGSALPMNALSWEVAGPTGLSPPNPLALLVLPILTSLHLFPLLWVVLSTEPWDVSRVQTRWGRGAFIPF